MTFLHVPNPRLEELSKSITQVEVGGKRHYAMNGLAFPSVTTILGSLPKAEQLEKWIDKVGTVEAERIKNNSARRGSDMHSVIEYYLKNEIPLEAKNATNAGYIMAHDLKPYLDQINNIHCLEQRLYSSKFKTAGTVDCIAEYDGELSVIDFKNARRNRSPDMILNYFYQTTAYAGLYEDMTGIRVDQIVILMAVENEAPQIFIRDPKEFVRPLAKIIKGYYNANIPTV